jgi:hypothetical protein
MTAKSGGIAASADIAVPHADAHAASVTHDAGATYRGLWELPEEVKLER